MERSIIKNIYNHIGYKSMQSIYDYEKEINDYFYNLIKTFIKSKLNLKSLTTRGYDFNDIFEPDTLHIQVIKKQEINPVKFSENDDFYQVLLFSKLYTSIYINVSKNYYNNKITWK